MIVAAFWAARIRGEAEAGKGKPLGDYLDELLTDDERLDKSSARLAAQFDALIERETCH